MTRPCLPALLALGLSFAAPIGSRAEPVEVDAAGATALPAVQVPASALMSREGNASRVGHILAERALKARPVAGECRALRAAARAHEGRLPVTVRDATLGGLPVKIYQPREGVAGGGPLKDPLGVGEQFGVKGR